MFANVQASSVIPISTGFTLSAADDGKQYACTTSLTITIPASLSPRPTIIVAPPPTGNLSIAVSGGSQINGGTSTLTRTRLANPTSIVVQSYIDYDGYGVSGV